MTMVIAYVWKDKIVMMADSRISRQNNKGEVIEYSDDSIKIVPLNRRGVIGHSGTRKLPTKEGYFDLIQITHKFVGDNQHISRSCTAKEAIEELGTLWNDTLKGFGDQTGDVNFCLLLGKWEERLGRMYPMLYSYSSPNDKYTFFTKGCIGDSEINPIMEQYFNKDLDGMDFEETINHFKKGFSEVINNNVETVGGFIHVYVLEANEIGSRWRDHRFFNTNN
ncbi:MULTISPECIES: hypothetical protein [Bacillus]|uniref:hypothetical protein n=1 Tax=Bacillus TaxID=1386 RepID=UPI0021128EAC|nr:hypothetical protein [Bacillus paranthracis]MCQ6520780.1 hypothetical protein [Bacillus paranthracis]MCU5229242.1 hypothetical protein [Bacillus paranthracis]MEC4604589.1 hypothetical protein [Bacillus paranthracis]